MIKTNFLKRNQMFLNILLMFVLAKLRELNANAPEDHRLHDDVLDNLEKLLFTVSDSKSQDLPTADQISILWRTIHWPEGTSLTNCVMVDMIAPFGTK